MLVTGDLATRRGAGDPTRWVCGRVSLSSSATSRVAESLGGNSRCLVHAPPPCCGGSPLCFLRLELFLALAEAWSAAKMDDACGKITTLLRA